MIWQPRPDTSQSVARAVGGVHVGPERGLAGVGTDSREACPEGLFVALVGPRFDGHAHVADAVRQGAVAALVMKGQGAEATTRIEVDDTTLALGRLGRSARRQSSAVVFGLTGSNGKTSSKELLAALLEAVGRGPTHRTPGNLNNAIGLPMTLLGLEARHRTAVIEMGMNARGEIDALTRTCEPDVVLVLNVGPAHIGNLGSLEAIAKAKGEAFRAAPSGATRVGNADDPRVMAQLDAAGGGLRYGWAEEADARIVERVRRVDGQTVRLVGPELVAHLPWSGAHQASNLAAAVACCVAAGFPLPKEIDLRGRLQPLAGRGARRRAGTWTLVDESYNANPASAVAALKAVVEEANGAPVMLLMGAMGELGEHAEAGHAEVGRQAADLGVAFVGAFGPGAQPVAATAAAAGIEAHHETDDEEALVARARAVLDDRPWWILIKGSRASGMERFARRLGGD